MLKIDKKNPEKIYMSATNNVMVRNYGMDLLKIISVWMIIISHMIGHGYLQETVSKYSIKWMMAEGLLCIFIPFLDCFGIVTGFLMYGRKRSWGRFCNLHMKVVLYSILIIPVALLLPGGVKCSSIIYHMIPTLSGRYWYWSAYVAVFLFIPYINAIIERLSSVECKRLLSVMFIVGVLLNVVEDGPMQGIGINYGYSAIWLMMLYCIGAILKKEAFLKKFRSDSLIIIAIVGMITTMGVTVLFQYGQDKGISIISESIAYVLYKYNSITVVTEAVCLVELFSRFKGLLNNKKICKCIVFLSNASMGVYLLHDHSLLREPLMTHFQWIGNTNLIAFMPLILFCAGGIYIICAFIDGIFSKIFSISFIKWGIRLEAGLYEQVLESRN